MVNGRDKRKKAKEKKEGPIVGKGEHNGLHSRLCQMGGCDLVLRRIDCYIGMLEPDASGGVNGVT